MLYDSAAEPPPPCDGGVLLSANGLRALKALDSNLYTRITRDLASPVLEALWFDLEGELVRRVPLGSPTAGAAGGSAVGGAANRRRARAGRPFPARGAGASDAPAADPDPAAPPLVISFHDLREALAEALPEEVEIFGRHHVSSLELCSSPGSAGGSSLLGFAASPSGSVVRTVRTKMVVGADGPKSAVKRLQFDSAVEQQQPQPSGRVVWRGRFTLRKRDPDFARLRSFTTATRSWVDLRATPGSERMATLSPAGPNTFVWSASCPASLLDSRGLQTSGGASPYWRCLAMFEDFPQDFFASLRATAASAVIEYDTCRAPTPAAAAGLAAPWRWFSGATALVGDAVYSLPVDDASSAGVNLTLEDAAVLGACTAQYGMTSRTLQEYARLRGSRVSALLALPSSAPERARLRDAGFLPVRQSAAALPQQPSPQPAAVDSTVSLTGVVAAAVDSAAAMSAAVPYPAQPLEQLLAKAAETAANAPGSSPPAVTLERPSGGASRTAPGAPATTQALPGPTGPSSPFFSRPSGARRLGPVPAAIAAVISMLAAAPGGASRIAKDTQKATQPSVASAGVAVASPVTEAAAATPAETLSQEEASPSLAATAAAAAAASSSSSSGAPVTTVADAQTAAEGDATVARQRPVFAEDSTPYNVWASLLRTHGSAVEEDATSASDGASGAARQYCSLATPLAVWQALLVPPGKAHDILASLPYDPTESPALAWMALLGGPAASEAAEATIIAAATASAAADAASAPTESACTLLPRPVLKQKQAASAAAWNSSTSAAGEASFLTAALEAEVSREVTSSTEDLLAPGAAPRPVTAAAATATAAAVGSAMSHSATPDQPRRRRPRSQAGPISGRWAGGNRRTSSKTRGSSHRTAAGAGSPAETSTAAAAAATSTHRSKAKARAKAVAAKAAATMTMSLSAAAALGGVIGAGTGHMPVDVAAALHAHGAVAQFWDELNNLTLSSASLSSIDMS